MAKKGQPVQLQLEVATDEEWEKLLQKEGLIVVDVYSDWCGPCLGMQANLRKIKLEIGGDMLQLAVAKSDGITPLTRFRNKSEPTWMFLSKGKMVNLMFGADAPKLTRLILEELKKEQAQQKGQTTDRTPLEVTDLAEEEKTRHDTAEALKREVKEKEDRKKAKELLDRRTKECENILANLPNYGTALIFPSARDKYKEVLNEILDEAGLNIVQTEKVHLDEIAMADLCYFGDIDEEFSEDSLNELCNKEVLMLLLKVSSRAEIEDIDNAILTLTYGHAKKPPGEHDSVAQKLIHEAETEDEVKKLYVGMWVPPTPQLRATALRMFFPRISTEYAIPEPPPTPEHLAIIFPLNKKDEALQTMQKFPKEVLNHGIFSSENCDEAKLVARTFKKLDKLDPSQRTYSEKLVIQVSKQKSECVLAFAQLEPIYMSPNAKEGKAECQKFFPEEQEVAEESSDEGEEEVEEIVQLEDGLSTELQEDEELELAIDEEKSESLKVDNTEVGESEVDEEAQVLNEAGENIPEEITDANPPTTDEAIVKLNNEMVEELLFFSETKFPPKTVEDFGGDRLSFALLFKRSNENLTGNIDDVVLQVVYGNSRGPPGNDKSPAIKLRKVWNGTAKPKDWGEFIANLVEDEQASIEEIVLLGIWAPSNSLSKALALKLFFPNLSNPFKMPELKEVPLHVAVAYDAFKAKEVFELSEKYLGKVMNFGYFSSDCCADAKLLGKTTDQFELRTASVTYEEKLIIQLAKDDPNCFMDFMDLGPSYVSRDVEIGEKECLNFFPPGYNTPEAEIITYLKKKTKRKGKTGKFKTVQDGDSQSALTEVDTSVADLVEEHDGEEVCAVGDEGNNEEAESEDEDGEEGDKDEKLEDAFKRADKATSPIINDER